MQRRLGQRWWVFCLIVSLVISCVAKADDFLYVLATSPGERSEIHWIPAHAPESARVLLEDLDQSEFIHRHRDELWWWTQERLVMGDLVGQRGEPLSEFCGSSITAIVSQRVFYTGARCTSWVVWIYGRLKTECWLKVPQLAGSLIQMYPSWPLVRF